MSKSLPRLILFGPPGAGKGTQSNLLCEKFSLPHISTGEMMREEIKLGSSLGKKVKAILDRGELVSDDLVIELVKHRVSNADCKKGYLLDGFPRTLAQAEQVTLLKCAGGDHIVTLVIELEVPEEMLLERISKRNADSTVTRSDDDIAVAAKRLKVYTDQTAPVAAYYRGRGELKEVDGVGSVEEVQSRIIETVKKSFPGL